MELRRAILLFAIILGLAAIATSLQRPASEQRSTDREPPPSPSTPSATAQPQSPSSPTSELTFAADLQPETERIASDQAATLTVTAEEPGAVEIPRLGLSGYAERLAPARFDLLPGSAGRYEVFFAPTEEGARRKIGIVKVAP